MSRTSLHKRKLHAKKLKAREQRKIQGAQLLALLDQHFPPIQIRIDLAPVYARLARELMETAAFGDAMKRVAKARLKKEPALAKLKERK